MFSIENLSNQQGMVIEEDKDNPLVVCKDENGKVSVLSAKCTHLGCIVTWNSLEKSFDCPCRGSKFFINGKVISDPLNNELENSEL